ncbi:MAG: toll/interleukin-1 receptor domain-containing protein [Flavobacteriales bacterium]|nr:toll/interleukin-1 receptor domain-containing protein [Flavobacteriales bacterium]
MAKIYLTGQRSHSRDNKLFRGLSYRLTELGHKIVSDDIDLGREIEISFRKTLNIADVIIPIITKSSLDSKYFYDELIQLRNYASNIDNKLVIPILSPNIPFDELPDSFLNINVLRMEGESDSEIDYVAKRIDESINSFLGKKIATEEKAQEIKEKIENTAPTYISQTLTELTKRERYQRNIAFFWYMLGFLALISGVGVAVWFANNGLVSFQGKENWSLTVFYALKSLFIIILLIAASKYCFNLAKSYMSESLKIADRIHAISFGKFYLQVFNQQINPGEIKDIFRDWNINNQTNNFSTQTADFDPKLLEKITEIVEKVKSSDKK